MTWLTYRKHCHQTHNQRLVSYDWDRGGSSHRPQLLQVDLNDFLTKLYEKGLAYEAEAPG